MYQSSGVLLVAYILAATLDIQAVAPPPPPPPPPPRRARAPVFPAPGAAWACVRAACPPPPARLPRPPARLRHRAHTHAPRDSSAASLQRRNQDVVSLEEVHRVAVELLLPRTVSTERDVRGGRSRKTGETTVSAPYLQGTEEAPGSAVLLTEALQQAVAAKEWRELWIILGHIELWLTICVGDLLAAQPWWILGVVVTADHGAGVVSLTGGEDVVDLTASSPPEEDLRAERRRRRREPKPAASKPAAKVAKQAAAEEAVERSDGTHQEATAPERPQEKAGLQEKAVLQAVTSGSPAEDGETVERRNVASDADAEGDTDGECMYCGNVTRYTYDTSINNDVYRSCIPCGWRAHQMGFDITDYLLCTQCYRGCDACEISMCPDCKPSHRACEKCGISCRMKDQCQQDGASACDGTAPCSGCDSCGCGMGCDDECMNSGYVRQGRRPINYDTDRTVWPTPKPVPWPPARRAA